VKLLLDTNIFLEILLGQTHSATALRTLENRDEHELFVSDYAIHSIGTLLVRRQLFGQLVTFLSDVVECGRVEVLGVAPTELRSVIDNVVRFGLDFDDAYQYALADRLDLTLVSLDRDFDRTPRGRTTPQNLYP